MTFNLYADEHIPVEIPYWLHRKGGHDVRPCRADHADPGGDGVSDEQLLQTAISLQRAVLTMNRSDFKDLHRRFSNHHGIIILKLPNSPKPKTPAKKKAMYQVFSQLICDVLNLYETLDGKLIRVPPLTRT
jgi:hypothetical protein